VLTYMLVLLPAGWLVVRGLTSLGSGTGESKRPGPPSVAHHSSVR